MAALNDWTVIDASNNAAPPDGWPENTMQYSDVNNTGRAVQGTLRRFFGDVNGSLQAGGVADAYTVTLNETGYVAYFQGMYFACEIMTTNTGASTINVNGIGVQTITDSGGNALAAGELIAGGIYEFRYDGTNFQLIGSLGDAVSTLNVSSSDPIDLVDVGNPLNVGAADPTNDPHLAFDFAGIHAKADATTVDALSINEFGGVVTVGGPSQVGGGLTVYQSGDVILNTVTGAFRYHGNSNNNPATGGTQDSDFEFMNNVAAEIGRIRWDFSTDMDITNFVHGGSILLRAEDTGGTIRNLLTGDPDAGIAGFFGGAQRFATITNGVEVQGSVAGSNPPVEADSPDTQIHFEDLNSIQIAELGYQGNSTFGMFNLVRGGQMTWRGTSTAGAVRVLSLADPDGAHSLSHVGVAVARTLTAANGGWEVNNTLDGGGFERVATIAEGSFTPSSYGGFSVDPDWDFEYQRIGRLVILHLASTSTPTGTSSSGVMTASGLPTDIRPTAAVQTVVLTGSDNGVSATIQATIGSTGVITFTRTDLAAFNAAGAKGLFAGASIMYMLD